MQNVKSESVADLRVWAFIRYCGMEDVDTTHAMRNGEYIDPVREEEVTQHRKRVDTYFKRHPEEKRGKSSTHVVTRELSESRKELMRGVMRLVDELPDVWSETAMGRLPYRRVNPYEVFARAMRASMKPITQEAFELWKDHCRVKSVRRREDRTRRKR